MRMGIVFELQGERAVVMKSDGSFAAVPAGADWQVGDAVPIPEKKRPSLRIWYTLAACLALVVLGLAGGRVYGSPTALVGIDINPSVELAINRFDRVIAADALNREGARLLEDVPVAGKKYDEAVRLLLSGERAREYLDRTQAVTFSIQTAGDEQALLQRLQQAVEDSAGINADVQVEYLPVDRETVEAAHHYGITAGKYLAIQDLREADPAADIDDYTHHTIGEIRERARQCRAHQSAEDSAAAGDDEQGSADSGQGSAGSGQSSAGSGQGSAGSGQGSAGSGQGSVDSGQGFADSGHHRRHGH